MEEFLEKSYYWELERKDKLNAAAAFPVGLSAICANLIYFSLTNNHTSGITNFIINTFIIMSSFCLAMSIIAGFEFFAGFQYKYVGKAEEFAHWMDELVAHSARFQDAPDPKVTFLVELTRSFARSADHNAANNDRKSTLLYWMNTFVGASLALALCGSGIVALSNGSSSKIEQVNVYG